MASKYSFKQFLTQNVEVINNSDKTETTKVDKITIPMIQRDYAQGRKTTISKQEENKLNPAGQKFIEEIFKVLTSEKEDIGLELDFIYGSLSVDSAENKTYFNPLDGQQRLTTLYLLYWFVGGAELLHDERANLSGILENFYYETRSSSTVFCRSLVSELNKNNIQFCRRTISSATDDKPALIDTIVTQIENLSWFHDSFKLDPTIVSMLNMLDQIQRLYLEHSCNRVFEKLENLCFYVLPLSNFGLTEDLYVKMNARGKQLTNFENFKADLQNWIKSNAEKYNLCDQKYDGRQMPYDMFFINKIDNEWSQCFWKAQKNSDDKNFDPLLMSFIYKFMLNEYILNATGANKYIDKEADFIRLSEETEYFDFSVFERYLNKTTLDRLMTVLDKIAQHYEDIEDAIQPCWLSSDADKFDILKISLGLKERAVYCAAVLYLINNDLFEKKYFSDWMHVIWNIVENANIDSWRAAVGVIQLIDELSDNSNDIFAALADDTFSIISLQSKDTVVEERKKAKLREVNSDWISSLIDAEKHPLFRGSVSFLIPDDDSLDGFKHNFELAQIFFDEKGISEKYQGNSHIFLRALLSRYSSLADIKYHITDKVEKENALKNMLSSDPVVRTAIKEWFALPTENDVYTKLLSEVAKSSPIAVDGNDFDKKCHESLYKQTDLMNWMQENKAIRYKDNYISRPGSSYDWIFVYGYANEIIDKLVSNGWDCENKCYIGDPKVKIPYYWTAAGREIEVTKVLEQNGVQILLKCSVGKDVIHASVDNKPIADYSYLDEVTSASLANQFVQRLENKINTAIQPIE